MTTNIIQRPSPNLRQQPIVDFRLNDYEAAIWNKGYSVVIENMRNCPCKGNSSSFLSDCNNCQGTGYVYINPYETKILLSSMNYNNKYKEWSEEKIGSVTITSMNRDRISFMDRITVKDSISIHNELTALKLYENTKYLYTIYDILSINDIFVFEASYLPLKKLELNIDYTFERNKIIILGNYDVGKVFSVNYNHNLQYHVIDLIHDVRNFSKKEHSGNIKLEYYPVNCIARRSHYVINSLNFTGDNVIDNSYQ